MNGKIYRFFIETDGRSGNTATERNRRSEGEVVVGEKTGGGIWRLKIPLVISAIKI